MVGWSPAGGQTQSPYIFGGLEEDEKLIGHSSATGSSSGTAAGVAAGFAPLGIGTECVGSVITPANRAALYALKAGLDAIDTEGCFKYADCLDCKHSQVLVLCKDQAAHALGSRYWRHGQKCE